MKEMPRVILLILLIVSAAAALFGQTPPVTPGNASPQASQQAPPEVDTALRARVYQLEVQGKFNQALQLVAEDTKDLFVGTSKPSYQTVEMHSIRYYDDFRQAEVIVLVTRLLPIEGFMGHPLPTKIFSRWKLENGQWCYYVDPQKDLPSSPFGALAPPGLARPRPARPGSAPPASAPPASAPPASAPLASAPPASAPPGLGLPGTAVPLGVTPGASRPLPPMPANLPNPRALTLDKLSVQLKSSGPSAEKVAIFNPTPWVAVLTLSDPKVAGLTVKLDSLTIKQGQKAILSVLSSGDVQIPKTPITIVVRVQKTNQVIPIQVSFAN